ncbi:trans-sialidase, putative [Trypanosoma cruzi marinkellei]|uniref:Trans-sialidase, putative n=1 Tax=Trypanosoma cruzi marinkellei TaxID=85056 RepID=K2MQQ0_TRYCR|nr:trans-sialidase, putative [Trypanosoma cruzi marinkellei]
MHSRVAAVKAPRTHDRRRVIGSSERREGRESEPQRLNMSRRVFHSAVLLLVVMVMCCGTCGAAPAEENDGRSDLRIVKLPQGVDLFVPQKTLVQPKDGSVPATMRDSFASPSLVSAGGVIAAFAEGHINAKRKDNDELIKHFSSDLVAGYIDSAWNWPTLVEKVNEVTWRAHDVLGKVDTKNRVGIVHHPTSTKKGNKVFLLFGSSGAQKASDGEWSFDSLDLKLVVGEVTNSTGSEPSDRIKWGVPRPLFDSNYLLKEKSKFWNFFPSGGSGILMEDGTLVFSLMAMNEKDETLPMLVYSTDDEKWLLSEGVTSLGCRYPRVTKWEGSVLMIVDCPRMARGCTSRVTWGRRGRRPSGHSQACGSTHDQEPLWGETCMWMPSSPRPLGKGRSCCTLREGTPRGKWEGPLRSTFG